MAELVRVEREQLRTGTAIEVDDSFVGDGYGIPTEASTRGDRAVRANGSAVSRSDVHGEGDGGPHRVRASTALHDQIRRFCSGTPAGRSGCLRDERAVNFLPLAAGPHPRRVLTLMPRSGFPGPRSAWPQALLATGPPDSPDPPRLDPPDPPDPPDPLAPSTYLGHSHPNVPAVRHA